jgi:hypothetical protein
MKSYFLGRKSVKNAIILNGYPILVTGMRMVDLISQTLPDIP